MTKILEIEEGIRQPNVSYEDSDQRPVKGKEEVMLTIDLATGLDYSPNLPYFSDWLRANYCGDYDKVLVCLDGLSDEEVKRLLSKRESMYNISAVFHVIMGAR